jgi:hypothetical protein
MCGGVEPLQPADAVSVGAAQGAHSGIKPSGLRTTCHVSIA